MQIKVRFGGIRKEEVRNHRIEATLEQALHRFSDRVKQVYVFIEDVNGPRGGVDKQCLCVVYPRKMAPIVIRDHDDRLSDLITRVANRAAYTLSQRTARRRGAALRRRSKPSAPLEWTLDDADQFAAMNE